LRDSLNDPKVSIVIPARNEEKTLGDVLSSVFSQDYPRDKLEVIVVDDCSTDSTPEIATRFPTNYIRNQSPLGLAGSLNRGIDESSSSDIILTLHADCVPQAMSWLRHMVTPFSDPTTGIVTSFLVLPVEKIPYPSRYFCYIYLAGWFDQPASGELERRFQQISFAGNKCDAYRVDVLRKIGKFDMAFRVANEDIDVSEKVNRLGYKILLCYQALTAHTLSSHQNTIKSHFRKALWGW